MLWVPHLYGDLVEETVRERGYELVDSDTELWENEDGNGKGGSEERQGSDDEVGDLTRESWEVSQLFVFIHNLYLKIVLLCCFVFFVNLFYFL